MTLRVGQGFDIHPFSAAPALEGADSLGLLAEVVAKLAPRWEVANVDCTVIAETPRLAGRREELQARLAGVIGAPVSLKAKRGEGLGALGRKEGIACLAVALIRQR